MAFPWVQHETWDDGTRGGFDGETDAGGILDFPHYGELARQGLHPWQGAHAVRLRLADDATANIQEDDGFDLAADAVLHIWMPWLIGADLALGDGDTIVLFTLQSAGPVDEVVFGVRHNSGVYELFCGETGATRTLAIVPSNKRWYQVELSVNIDSGVGNDGTVDFSVDGARVGAPITGLNQGAITQAQLGAVSGTAVGNRGTILCGGIIADDARIYPRERFPQDTFWVTRDIVAWMGPCSIDAAFVTGTGADAVLTILDTDLYEATGIGFSREPRVRVANLTANDQSPSFNTPIELSRGAYVQLTGTNPQGWVSIKRPDAAPSQIVRSSDNYVNAGLRRKALV